MTRRTETLYTAVDIEIKRGCERLILFNKEIGSDKLARTLTMIVTEALDGYLYARLPGYRPVLVDTATKGVEALDGPEGPEGLPF